MEIIKPGVIAENNPKYKATCRRCGCVFTFTSKETYRARCYRKIESCINCPTCNYEITLSDSLVNMIEDGND